MTNPKREQDEDEKQTEVELKGVGWN